MSDDAVQVAPHVYKVLFENDKVRVLQATLKKGAKSAMHKHPTNLVYMIDGGSAKFTTPDGKSQKMRAKAGRVVWFDEQEHSSENLGTKTLRALIVELK